MPSYLDAHIQFFIIYIKPHTVNRIFFKSFMAYVFLLFLRAPAHAQTTIEFDQWTTAHGLSQVSVFAMMQDREGYLWFATENGLNQFDGYQFTHYTHSLFDSNSLSDQLVYTMIEDNEGIMWIACFGGGLNRFDRRTGKFIHYRHDPKNTASISSDTGPAGSTWQPQRSRSGTRSTSNEQSRP